jgi:hypothetical protein
VYLVQLSKSGKYASGKKVALNTLILRNVEAPSASLLNCYIFLQRCNILMYIEQLSCLRHICLTYGYDNTGYDNTAIGIATLGPILLSQP